MKKANLYIQRTYAVLITAIILLQVHFSVLLQNDDMPLFFYLYPLAFIVGLHQLITTAISLALKGRQSVFFHYALAAFPTAVAYFLLAVYQDSLPFEWHEPIPEVVAGVICFSLAAWHWWIIEQNQHQFYEQPHHVLDL
jgi:hypothetical protein